MKSIFGLITVLFFTVFFIACEDDPSSVGAGIIPNGDKIEIKQINSKDSLFQQSSTFYFDTLSLASSPRVFLGKHGNIKSSMLVAYSILLPDSLVSLVTNDSVTIERTWIDLFPSYRLGSGNNEFDFKFYKINEFWTATKFNLDSLNRIAKGTEDVILSKEITDTLITVDINNSVSLDWLKGELSENPRTNFGLVMDPTDGSNRLHGFQAIAQSFNSKISILNIAFKKLGNLKPDTISYSPVGATGGDVHVVESLMPEMTQKLIYAQAGYGVRSRLVYDISKLPKNIIINQAILKVKLDSTKSNQGTINSDSLYVNAFDDTLKNIINTSLSTTYLIKNANTGEYSGDIRIIIQSWLDGFENKGLRLRLNNERTTLNKLAFFGSGADDINDRPFLDITYTIKK